MYFDTEEVMHEIGFKGYGDHTHGGLTVFLSLVFGFMTSLLSAEKSRLRIIK